ncbi:plasma-membrane calcium-translocating P-type ATPase [Amphibacillus marinus]|uniref:P-type Ca(2+) transporter n=1 Tax=Amphibacillus marinus TaxID=872970 RepID=A0A1H8KDK9_9BACI|nr:cation-transporting P-type ATPase [Amphibacillus marinus]SEN91050.1 plasma-membrane calcium-translocating P-type ATPase [Amphibacillus marinus]
MKRLQWYSYETDEVERRLKTDLNAGLTSEQIEEAKDRWGSNELPESKKTPAFLKFLHHFNDVLIYILLAAAVLTVTLGHYVDTIVILIVVVINALIGYIQENKAEKALEGIKNMLSLQATVIRNGERKEIASSELVPGDLVLLAPGDKIPADLRLITTDHLSIEESPLTGESTSVEKDADTLSEDTTLGDRLNMAFSGTAVVSGSGRGIVVETGTNTELGQINQSIAEVEEIETPLLRQIAEFGRMIAFVIIGIAALLFVYGLLFHDYEWGELLLYVISLTVSAIPEGLPAILSIILALGVQVMAKNNAIMRTLPSVETLGAVTVICSDKTGTLTKNEMTVQSVVLKDRIYEVTGTGYAPEGEIKFEGKPADVEQDQALRRFLTNVRSINDTTLRKAEDGQWQISGEPTEGCLVTLAEKANREIEPLEMIAKLPFDSAHKYMAGLVEEEAGKVIYVKGAPDKLFDMAGLEEGSEERQYWEEQLVNRSRRGERVIGAAVKQVEDSVTEIDHHDVAAGLTIIGLAGIMDPPREEAVEAVKVCRRAGIQVKMITGDHKETALAIAKQMGLTERDRVVEGREIDRMSDQELKAIVEDVDVFARTSPENKLQLVKALQKNGEVCAMTGDGVNDAPALKRADIGVAMGVKGTEVAKEASEMVLVDDNFKTIVNAVKEGRRVYDNLKKTILFILPTNGAEAFLIISALLIGIDMPLTPIQVLYVNMVTAVTVSFALAFEKLEAGAMQRPPRSPDAKLLSGYYVFRILLMSVLIGGAIMVMNVTLLGDTAQYTAEQVNTITLHSIVIAQVFHVFNVRNERQFAFNKDFFSNKIAFGLAGLLVLLQVGITYTPFLSDIFGLYPIEAEYWLYPFLIGIIGFIVIEIEKFITRKISQAHSNRKAVS